MATYTPTELRRKWSKGELTSDQLLGQLVQFVIEFAERLTALEKRTLPGEQPATKPQSS
jgi:hypothetical protein